MGPAEKWLRDAAEMIRRVGWCQGQSCDSAGRVCAQQALSAPAGSTDTYVESRAYFRKVIGLEKSDYVHKWNDARGRTADEVISAFDRAADLAAAENA